ncbi:hypothetical protein EDB86DRAFT_2890878 [Lactarius hatsudake]|nr:hypothetical protein EDB86DRAFT_2890878 [Lactarius hatsudake]
MHTGWRAIFVCNMRYTHYGHCHVFVTFLICGNGVDLKTSLVMGIAEVLGASLGASFFGAVGLFL